MGLTDRELGKLYVDIIAKTTQLEADIRRITKSAEVSTKQIESQFQRAKLRFDDSLSKKSIKEIEMSVVKLRAHLEKKIAMGATLGELDALNSSLKKAENAVQTFGKKTQVIDAETAGRWGMFATGVQQVTEGIRQFVQQMKMLLGQSVMAAADLEVLRSQFKGSATDLELFKKAVSNTISEGKLIALSNKARALGLGMEEQAIAFAFAENAVDSFGGTIEENFIGLVNASEGMGRGLKSVGVQTKVYQENLKALTKETGLKLEQLSAEEQKTIMLKATIASLGLTLEDVKKKQKDNKDLLESYNITVEEARIKLGKLILEGLTPLLKEFDESGNSFKIFYTSMVAIIGTVISAIPLVIQLLAAKKMLSAASIMSANATSTETSAIIANTTARVANMGLMTKLGALFSSFGLTTLGIGAVASVIMVLGENIRGLDVKKAEDMARALDQLAKDRTTATSLGFSGQVNQSSSKIHSGSTTFTAEEKMGLISPRWIKQDVKEVESQWVSTGKTVGEINEQIQKLTVVQNGLVVGSIAYAKNVKEIESLEKLISKSKDDALSKGEKELQNLREQRKLYIQRANEQEEFNRRTSDYVNSSQSSLDEKILKEHQTFVELSKAVEEWNNLTASWVDKSQNEIDEKQEKLIAGTERWASTVTSAFSITNMQGRTLIQVFEGIVTQLIEAVAQAAVFASIMSLLNPSNAGGFLGFFAKFLGFAEQGGSFRNGAKVASFAGGGSMMVPNAGFSGDYYPLMVKGGERVDVTPNYKVGDTEKALNGLIGRVEALTMATIKNRGNANVTLYLDSKLLAEATTERQNEFERGNVDRGRG